MIQIIEFSYSDADLAEQACVFAHPLVNDMTLGICGSDLIRFFPIPDTTLKFWFSNKANKKASLVYRFYHSYIR